MPDQEVLTGPQQTGDRPERLTSGCNARCSYYNILLLGLKIINLPLPWGHLVGNKPIRKKKANFIVLRGGNRNNTGLLLNPDKQTGVEREPKLLHRNRFMPGGPQRDTVKQQWRVTPWAFSRSLQSAQTQHHQNNGTMQTRTVQKSLFQLSCKCPLYLYYYETPFETYMYSFLPGQIHLSNSPPLSLKSTISYSLTFGTTVDLKWS